MNPGFEEVMSIRGRGMPEAGEVSITGSDPVLSARFKIGETTARTTTSKLDEIAARRAKRKSS